MERCRPCDTIEPVYRLPYPVRVRSGDQQVVVPVEVSFRFRLSRCIGENAIGDLVHSMTLLPGESVRAYVSDSNSRFSYDSSTQTAHFAASTSHESAFMSSMSRSVSDLRYLQNDNMSSTYHEDSVSGSGSLGIDLGFVSIGGGASGSSYDAASAARFARSITQHADTSSRHTETAVRARSSVSIATTSTRHHAEGESEQHFESASRVFRNDNRCRSVSHLFYQVVTCGTIK